METASHNYCIILAGGAGRRLWPASRKEFPKQFIDFFGSGRTLLQQTYDRYAHFIPLSHIFVSTYEAYLPLVREQLPDLPEGNILSEPVQLNTTSPAVWGTWNAAVADAEARIVVSPADQLIQREAVFEAEVLSGLEYVGAHDDFLVMGVRPSYANTAYGYIQKGDEAEGEHLYRVQSFSEKPEESFARMFLESGEFLWNTGLYLWKASTLANHFSQNSNRPRQAVEKLARQMLTIAEELEYVRSCYPEGTPKAVDFLVLETCDNVVVKECSFGWADVGCWSELGSLLHTDADGNGVSGGARVMFSGTQRCVVRLPQGMKAVIAGLDNYVVAAEGDTLMICPNADADYVRRLINEAQVEL